MVDYNRDDKFSHGGDIYNFSKIRGIKVEDVIDFSSNINFLRFTKRINVNFAYPDNNYSKFKSLIKKRYGVKKKYIELFNGGSSAIFSLFKNLNFNSLYLFAPIYLEYKRAGVLFNKEILLIDRFNTDFSRLKFKKDSLVIFVNPSTPDGKLYQRDVLIEILKSGVNLLVDESFLDFTDADSMVDFIDDFENLYILKSLTKFYSSAGARVGVLISKNIKQICKFEPLWRVSSLDTEYFSSILNSKKFIIQSKLKNRKNKELLIDILNSSNRFDKIFDSSANYILTKTDRVKEITQELEDKNILVRNCHNFDFLDNRYIRFAVKEKKLLDILQKALFK